MRLAGTDFFQCHPDCTDNAFVQRLLRIMGEDAPGEGEAQISGVGLRCVPAVNADEMLRLEFVSCFLQCFACHRSPLILRCVEDYLAGKRYPLELLTHYD